VEQVRDDGGCDGGVTGFSHAHQSPHQDEPPEILANNTQKSCSITVHEKYF